MNPSRIVVVDDEPIIRMDLREILQAEGFEVVAEGRNGEDAVRLARELQPDLIIMDIKMPMMDGLKSARIIHNLSGGAVLLVTAYSQKELIRKAAEAGVVGYLVKPVTARNLIPTVHVALDQLNRMRELRNNLMAAERKLEERKWVDAAKGRLMERYGLTEREAYERLRRQSMDRSVPLAQLAKSYALNKE